MRQKQKECTCKDGLGPHTCTTILISSIQVMWLRSRLDQEAHPFGHDRMRMLIHQDQHDPYEIACNNKLGVSTRAAFLFQGLCRKEYCHLLVHRSKLGGIGLKW